MEVQKNNLDNDWFEGSIEIWRHPNEPLAALLITDEWANWKNTELWMDAKDLRWLAFKCLEAAKELDASRPPRAASGA